MQLRPRNFYHLCIGGNRRDETVPCIIRCLQSDLRVLNRDAEAVLAQVVGLLRRHLPTVLPRGLTSLQAAGKKGSGAAAAAQGPQRDATELASIFADAAAGRVRSKAKGKGKGKGKGKRRRGAASGVGSGSGSGGGTSSGGQSATATGAAAQATIPWNVFRGDTVTITISFRATETRYAVLTFDAPKAEDGHERPAKRRRTRTDNGTADRTGGGHDVGTQPGRQGGTSESNERKDGTGESNERKDGTGESNERKDGTRESNERTDGTGESNERQGGTMVKSESAESTTVKSEFGTHASVSQAARKHDISGFLRPRNVASYTVLVDVRPTHHTVS